MSNLKAMKFRVESPEHSEKIQRALFCQGYRWLTNPLTLQHTDATFLHTIFTLSVGGRYIDYAESEHWFNVDKKDVPEYVLFEGHFVRKDSMATYVEAPAEQKPAPMSEAVLNAVREKLAETLRDIADDLQHEGWQNIQEGDLKVVIELNKFLQNAQEGE